MRTLNYKHLFYFWVVAKEGGMARAAERLGMAVQTVSSQVRDLEKALGKVLFVAEGRRLVLTDAGRTALGYADQIFLLGQQMREAMDDEDAARTLRFSVGVIDSLPKLVSFRLLDETQHLDMPVRLICHEGKFENLIADLALHRLDVVLSDRALAPGTGVRMFSHPLGSCGVGVFGVPELQARYAPNFPDSLNGAPFLMPSRNTALRSRLDQWFETRAIRPRVVAEFDDSALMKTFGRGGHGLFPAPNALLDDLSQTYGAIPLGELEGVREHFYAISNERRISHPGVEAVRAATEKTLFPQG